MIPDTAIPPIPGQQQEPMPHVEFELVPTEDREASLKAGQKIMKDTEFISIYPRGGKDKVRKKVPDAPQQGQYPTPQWQEFEARFGPVYNAWKKGLDIPIEGTDLRNFPLLTPAQIENCRTFHILTVEQLADANEETLNNIGMGSRNLKMTAQKWLNFGEDGGKQISHMEELEAKNQTLTDQVAQLSAKLAEMEEKKAQEPTKRKPGRPKRKQ